MAETHKTCAKFYYYVLLAATEQLNALGKGTTFLELSADALGTFCTSFPPVPEQQAIAYFLDHEIARIDTLIAKQQRLTALLAENARR